MDYGRFFWRCAIGETVTAATKEYMILAANVAAALQSAVAPQGLCLAVALSRLAGTDQDKFGSGSI
jgi:hypothetical protein